MLLGVLARCGRRLCTYMESQALANRVHLGLGRPLCVCGLLSVVETESRGVLILSKDAAESRGGGRRGDSDALDLGGGVS